jgi:hypothetical protein
MDDPPDVRSERRLGDIQGATDVGHEEVPGVQVRVRDRDLRPEVKRDLDAAHRALDRIRVAQIAELHLDPVGLLLRAPVQGSAVPPGVVATQSSDTRSSL